MQMQIEDFPLKKYWCPIAREWFRDVHFHNKHCIYTYCKNSKWFWSKGLIKTEVAKGEFVDMILSPEVMEQVNQINEDLQNRI